MSTKKTFYFNNTKTFLLVFILFLTFSIVYFIIFPYFVHEAFCMDPYEYISFDEDIPSDEDVNNRLIIAKKESYMSYDGNYTYNTRLDLFESLYPNGLPVDYSVINDPYDGEKYFDIPLTMIFGESNNIDSGIYSSCISRNIDGLLIWPERLAFQTEFVKDYTQVIPKDSNISSVGLGVRTIHDRVVFVYVKCKDIYGNKYNWTIWEKDSLVKYWSYKAFKKRWDSEISVWSNIDDNIRKDIIIEVKDLLGLKRLDKNLRKSVRSEIEKLIRETRSFSSNT